MLEEQEWKMVVPHLTNALEQIMRYREEHGVSLAEAREKGYGQQAMRVYEMLTGHQASCADALWHHRISIYGPPCSACGKP